MDEPFTFITTSRKDGSTRLFEDYRKVLSGRTVDLDVYLVSALRQKHPELIVTTTPVSNVNLLQFAAAGMATAELDTETETVIRWRGYVGPNERGSAGSLGEATFFAKYHYKWGNEDFILYTVVMGLSKLQYVLKEPRSGETTLSHSVPTDSLIATIGQWASQEMDAIYVFDNRWYRSSALWDEVQKASWDKVILDPDMKKSLTDVSEKFFDSKDTYEEYGVPWKRGLIFYGPAGNGKTISIKALMRTLGERKQPIPTLYVKAAPYTYMLRAIFELARLEAPCLLVIEDIDTIVTQGTRAYFFNEVDGLENNNGILMLATTNHLDKLDPGLSKRPSRFDRKYLFPLPSEAERVTYCQFWREKAKDKPIDFPEKLCPAIASITDGFSFAYMQEAFMATLLAMAREKGVRPEGLSCSPKGDDDLNDYELWRVIKKQVKLLRDDMDSSEPEEGATSRSQSEQGTAQGADEGMTLTHSHPFDKAEGPTLEDRIPTKTTHLSRSLTPMLAQMTLRNESRVNDQMREWGGGPRFGGY